MLGLMGLYIWLCCWVRLIPVTQSRESAVVIRTQAKCRKKQADHIFTQASVPHRLSNLLKNSNNLPETPGLRGSRIHLSWSARSQMWVFRWKQLIMLLLWALPFSIFIFALFLGSEKLVRTHSLQSQHRWTPHQMSILTFCWFKNL